MALTKVVASGFSRTKGRGGLGVLGILCVLAETAPAQRAPVPRAWDQAALASMELPLVNAVASARHVSPDYYYRIPVRPIYKSYPIYAPGREPQGYMERLAQLEPELAF